MSRAALNSSCPLPGSLPISGPLAEFAAAESVGAPVAVRFAAPPAEVAGVEPRVPPDAGVSCAVLALALRESAGLFTLLEGCVDGAVAGFAASGFFAGDSEAPASAGVCDPGLVSGLGEAVGATAGCS